MAAKFVEATDDGGTTYRAIINGKRAVAAQEANGVNLAKGCSADLLMTDLDDLYVVSESEGYNQGEIDIVQHFILARAMLYRDRKKRAA